MVCVTRVSGETGGQFSNETHGTMHSMTAASHKPAAASVPQKALEKLGLKRDIDLALHLPLRYEDETRITRLRDARDGDHIQIEARVMECEVSYRPRKQLVVTVDDGSDPCTLRFFSFYPSQQKALAVGNRILARGEIKGGFLGRTMLHPAFRAAGGDLPTALTPIYPTVAGLPQPYLRKAVLAGLARAELSDTFAPGDLSQLDTHIGSHPFGHCVRRYSFCITRRPTCPWIPCRTTATRHGSGLRPRSCWPSSSASCKAAVPVPPCVRPNCACHCPSRPIRFTSACSQYCPLA